MIDLYFQSSPPLTSVTDFFIYQQLSLSFHVCPGQPILRFKCCVKQIHALTLQVMVFSCCCSRTVCWARALCSCWLRWKLSPKLGIQPGAASACWDVSHGTSHAMVSPSLVVTAGLQLGNAGAPFLWATIHLLSIVYPYLLDYCVWLELRILLNDEK